MEMSYRVSQRFSPPGNVDLCSCVVGGVMSDPCFVVDVVEVSQTFFFLPLFIPYVIRLLGFK